MDLPPQLEKPRKLFDNPQWQRCYEDYLKYLWDRSNSAGTVRNASHTLHCFFKNPEKTPANYTRSDVEQFMAARIRTDPKPRTRNLRLAILKSFYAYASDYTVKFREKTKRLMDGSSPARHINRAVVEDTRRALEPEEVLRFLDVIRPAKQTRWAKEQALRDYALFLVLLTTGRRESEIINLRWGDISPSARLSDGSLGVGYKWKGKGHVGKDSAAEMPQVAWDAICSYLIAAERFSRIKPQDAIFISKKTQWQRIPISPEQVGHRFRKYACAAGMRLEIPDVVVHSLRITFAIECYEACGRDIKATMEALGHKDPGTTMLYLLKRRRPKRSTAGDAIGAKYAR